MEYRRRPLVQEAQGAFRHYLVGCTTAQTGKLDRTAPDTVAGSAVDTALVHMTGMWADQETDRAAGSVVRMACRQTVDT